MSLSAPAAQVASDVLVDRDTRARSLDEDGARTLALRARDGDTDAFETLYDRYVERIYRYLYYRVRRDEEAEDLTSEVFFRALRAMPRYRPDAPFLAWLYRIAHNAIVDRSRAMPREVAFDDAHVEATASGVDPTARTLERERGRRVRDAISRLSPDQQDVVVLRFVDGLSSDEIGQLVRKPASTVRGLQRRALANLRRMLPREISR